jgi:hypothetical protein
VNNLTLPAPSATSSTAPAAEPFSSAQRCDSCGAQAYVGVQVASDTFDEAGKRKVVELLFCAHHYAEHEPALAASTATRGIDDQRHILMEEESCRVKE